MFLMKSTEEYGICEEQKVLHAPCVLYRDYNGFWSPIYALYWSTSSRLIVSRHPFSCIEEIISQYCPQCMSRYMEDEVRTSQNSCPSCFQCPKCMGILISSAKNSSDSKLSCHGCGWHAIKANTSQISITNELFSENLKALKNEESNNGVSLGSAQQLNIGKRWKLSDLEASLESKQLICEINKDSGLNLEIPVAYQVDSDAELTTLAQRVAQPGLQQSLVKFLSPIRVCLRSKRTLRCRRDVEEGKMSILVQPKLFPLEGDSSQKLNRGKWFVKDSSAIHELPSIVITKLPDCQVIKCHEVSYLHLTVANPKDFKVTIKINNLSTKDLNKIREKSAVVSHPFICKTASISLDNNNEDIRFELGPFEDELLRDDDDEFSDENGFIEGSDLISSEMSTRGWSCSVSHNVAHLIVRISYGSTPTTDSNEGSGDEIAAFVLPLHITTKKDDASERNPTFNIFEFESIIAFPNI